MIQRFLNNTFKAYFEKNVNLPVINPNMQEDIEFLCEKIIYYFRKE